MPIETLYFCNTHTHRQGPLLYKDITIIIIAITIILIIITIIIIIIKTRDVALLEDPIYLNYVQLFASSMTEFDQAFASAW